MITRPGWTDTADVVVIGTGVAGLAAALAAHRAGRKVVVLSKADRRHGVTATHYAQGGIAVVLPDNPENEDSVDDHVADTLAAGAGMCDSDACTRSSPTATVRSLNWSVTERVSTNRCRVSGR